jgi:hypothetical protein
MRYDSIRNDLTLYFRFRFIRICCGAAIPATAFSNSTTLRTRASIASIDRDEALVVIC